MKSREDLDALERALRCAAEPMPDAARANARRRLMLAIGGERPAGFLARQSRWVAAAATVATLFLGSGVAYAANQSLPGDSLYPVKRAMENALVAVLPSGNLEHEVLVSIAERRAEEAGVLARRDGSASDPSVTEALEQLRNSVQNAGGETGLQEEERIRIRTGAGELPAWADTEVDRAVGSSHTSGGTIAPEAPAEGPSSPESSSPSADTTGSAPAPGGGSGSQSGTGEQTGPQNGSGSGPKNQ